MDVSLIAPILSDINVSFHQKKILYRSISRTRTKNVVINFHDGVWNSPRHLCRDGRIAKYCDILSTSNTSFSQQKTGQGTRKRPNSKCSQARERRCPLSPRWRMEYAETLCRDEFITIAPLSQISAPLFIRERLCANQCPSFK